MLLVTWGALVDDCRGAASGKEGVSVAVVDLRTIMPGDWAMIVKHVKRMNRIVIAHEDRDMRLWRRNRRARRRELFEHLDAP